MLPYELRLLPEYTRQRQAKVCSYASNSDGCSAKQDAVNSAVNLTNAEEMNKLH